MRDPLLALLLLAGVLVAPALAQPSRTGASATTVAPTSGAGPSWAELLPAQRAALAPLQPYWDRLDDERKRKWLAVAQRYSRLPESERARVQARMAQWAQMSPAERGKARQRYQELRRLPADDRQALWDAYNSLPPEERQALARRAAPGAAPSTPRQQPGAVAPATGLPAARPARAAARTPGIEIGKREVPVNPQTPATRPVTPTVIQVDPGVSTTLVNRNPNPPLHTQPGLPKIAATPGFVDPQTLLPSRGPQAAATIRLAPEPPAARNPIAAPVRPVPRRAAGQADGGAAQAPGTARGARGAASGAS